MRALVFMFTPMVLLAFAVIFESPEAPEAPVPAPIAETQPLVEDDVRLATASPVDVDAQQDQTQPATSALLVDERAITL